MNGIDSLDTATDTDGSNFGLVDIDKIPKPVLKTFHERFPSCEILKCDVFFGSYSIGHILIDKPLTTMINHTGEFVSTFQDIETNEVPFNIIQGFLKVKPSDVALEKVKCQYILENTNQAYYEFNWLDDPIYTDTSRVISQHLRLIDLTGIEINKE